MLVGVKIRNFDVFDEDKCGLVMDDYLNPTAVSGRPLLNLNALIGRNMTGKTSFISAMHFIKHSVVNNVATASTDDELPGFTNLLIDKDKPAVFQMYFNIKPGSERKTSFIEYDLSIAINIHGSPYIEEEKVFLCKKTDGGLKKLTLLDLKKGEGVIAVGFEDDEPVLEETSITDSHTCAVKIYGMIRAYKYIHALYREISKWFFCRFSSGDRSDYFAAGNAPGGHRHLNSTGSNVQNVLNYLKTEDEDEYNRIVEEINDKIPLMKRKAKLPKSLDASPDKLFLYLLLLRDKDPHSTIFIETPDKDLYHDMVDILAAEMRDFTINNPYNQIIFTTHNPYIIETMSPKEIWVFRRTFGQDVGDVSIVCAASDPGVEAMFKQGVGMGAIWYGGHLDEEEDDEEE